MSAFGRKNGVSGMTPGARPTFGVAKPMKAGGPMGMPRPPMGVPQMAGAGEGVG